MEPSCIWSGTIIEETAFPCGPVEWIVAYMCDRCGRTGTQDTCISHYSVYMDGTLSLSCAHCHGTLSFIAASLDGTSEQEMIN